MGCGAQISFSIPDCFAANYSITASANSPSLANTPSRSTSSPLLHKDPFDRLLIAQGIVEGITLITADPIVARYPGPMQRV
jgi:PIN domain nuclease of toxin-antitoxin system